ncbi:hypothetical protein [Cellulomonas sp.]
MTKICARPAVLVTCATAAMLYLVLRGVGDMFSIENTTDAVLLGLAGRRMLTIGTALGVLTAVACVVTGSRWWACVMYVAGPVAATAMAWATMSTALPQLAVLVGFIPLFVGAVLMTRR